MVLSVVWFAAAIGGASAGLAAVLVDRLRRPALMAAGSCFAVAGVLGIFSVGLVFIALAVFCFTRLASVANAESH